MEFSYPNSEHVRAEADQAAAPKAPVPESVQVARDADPSRALHKAAGMLDVKLEPLPLDATPEQRAQFEAEHRELLETYADMGFSSPEANEVHGLIKQHAAAPADAATRSTWAREAEDQLRRTYGDSAPQALADARKLVQRDPRALALLQATGLGSNPRVVELLARQARSERGRGRLK